MSVDEWYNAVQAQTNLAKYPAETAKILHRNIFCFFLRDEEFYLKQSMTPTFFLKNFQPIKLDNLPKDYNHLNLQQDISRRCQVNHKPFN